MKGSHRFMVYILAGFFIAFAASFVYSAVVIENKDLSIVSGGLVLTGSYVKTSIIPQTSGLALGSTSKPWKVHASDILCDDCIALGSETVGSYIATAQGGPGITISGGSGEGVDITISHIDNSNQQSVDNNAGSVIQDVLLDEFGHVTGLASVDLDGRYYTKQDSDNRFVNASGDTMTGDLNVSGTVYADAVVGSNVLQAGDLVFKNDFRVIEDGDVGLIILNPQGEPIMRIDVNGNLWVRGKIRGEMG